MEPKERIIKAIEQWYIGTISWRQLDEQIDVALTLSTKKSKESIATVDGNTIVFTNEEEFEKTCKATEELIARFDEEFGDKENQDEGN